MVNSPLNDAQIPTPLYEVGETVKLIEADKKPSKWLEVTLAQREFWTPNDSDPSWNYLLIFPGCDSYIARMDQEWAEESELVRAN